MNNKKKTFILIGLFAFLMIGASVLYNNLSANYTLDSLVVENNNSNSANNEANNQNSDTANNETHNQNSDTADNEANNQNSDTADNEADNHNYTDESNKNSAPENNTETSSENENKLTKAPNFTVYDLAGNEVNLTDFFGKPIIVNFWASWCGPCQMEMPDFDAAYTSYKDEIEFLVVNMTDGSRETVEIASSFIEEKGYTFPVYYDTEYSAAIT